MRPEHLLVALLAAIPAAYAWWSGRRILRSLEDPALVELLQARRRRVAQVTVGAIIVAALTGTPLALAIPMLVGLLVAQYPIRRAVYGDEWSLVRYVAYCTASFVAAAGLLLVAIPAPVYLAGLVRAWLPGPTRASFGLALALGALCAAVVLVWHRRFTTIWLWLHRASPLETDAAHAPLLPRLHAVLDRAADRLGQRPSIHRFGVDGGRITNAIALPSLHEPAVAMSDTLLDNLDADETTAIFAHEIAHHEYFNTVRLRARRRLLVVVALLVTLLPALLLATGPHSDLMVSAAFLVIVVALLVRGQAPKRQQETASDLRAVELTDDPEALIRALTKVHVLARLPRRWAQEVERAATHPSLARRIQAIRAHAHVESASLDTPTVVAAATPGSWVVLDATRVYWLDGVPADGATDLASLRERASSYRAMTYRELAELRLVATHGQRALRATDLAGHSWSVDVREADVAVIQAALDTVDSGLGATRVEASMRSDRAVRLLAAALLIAAILGGGTVAVAIPALATMIAPTTASLAALGAMGTAGLLLLGSSDSFGLPREMSTVLLAAVLGLGTLWLAWSWHRARRESSAPNARLAVRLMFALLVVGALSTLLMIGTTWTSPRDLAGDEQALSLAITFCGLGAALLTLRATALRLAGAGAALLGVVALGTATLSERLWPAASAIEWADARPSLVTTVPLSYDADAIALSPSATRYLTRRTYGNGDGDDDGTYATRFTTGDVAQRAAPYTVSALDAALPNETEILLLATTDDSLELRLERVRGDSADRVLWRRAFGKLHAPTLRLLDFGKRWQVSGMRVGERGIAALVTLDGAVHDSAGVDASLHRTEFAPDPMRGQSVFTYRDGSRLVMSLARSPMLAARGRSALWTTLVALRGVNMTWDLSRQDRAGVHPVRSLHGAVRCWSGGEDDAVCVDQSMRGVHALNIARDGSVVDLGTLPRRYQRATVSHTGLLVASSYTDRSLAVLDVVPRKGLRITLPPVSGTVIRDVTATGDVLALVLSGEGGSRLEVYRLGPPLESASRASVR